MEKLLADLRAAGWFVAVHNDYTVMGRRKTFWLFTHPDTERFVKGEGSTDLMALEMCHEAATALTQETKEE